MTTTRLAYCFKKPNTEKTNKVFTVTEEIKLGGVNFRSCSYSLVYLLNKLALTQILRGLQKTDFEIEFLFKKIV